ncbi:hypothetical protein ccbrp13_06020 [Ktedonobacteria bacterium brp13]|nr:hypothetical protein ccbrp13_06020 [Ktedonobacteria bacterium brp13]
MSQGLYSPSSYHAFFSLRKVDAWQWYVSLWIILLVLAMYIHIGMYFFVYVNYNCFIDITLNSVY